MSTPLAGAVLPGSPGALEAQALIDHQIAKLRQTITNLHAQLHALRRQRNELSLSSRLPSDILSTIFIQCAQIHHESMTKRTGVVPGWVNVSYVCRYWRDVALNCPTLWTYVSTTSEHWTNVLLSRSKQASLKIRFRWTIGDSWQLLPLLKQVLDHTGRIQELDLRIQSGDSARVFSMVTSPAPRLQSLAVAVLPATYTPHTMWPFFNGDVPALCRLELSGCPVPQTTSMLSSLTTLILHDAVDLRISEFTTLLSSMQSLVHLELHDVFSGTWQISKLDAHTVDQLQLPHLLRLVIEEDLVDIVNLLSCLDISSQTEVRIHAYRPSAEEDWTSFRSLLVQKFFTSGAKTPSRVRALMIDSSMDSLTKTIFSRSEPTKWCPEPPLDWGCNIPLQITLIDDFNQPDPIRLIQDAADGGFLAGLQSVSIAVRGDRDDCSTLVEDALCFLPELRHIHFIGSSKSLGCLFSFLSLSLHQRKEEHDEDTSFAKPLPRTFAPRLEELVIDSAIFDQTTGSASNLYEALAIRKENGYALRQLALSKCRNLFKEDVTKLKSLVTEVVWDGIETADLADGGWSGRDEDVDSEDEGEGGDWSKSAEDWLEDEGEGDDSSEDEGGKDDSLENDDD